MSSDDLLQELISNGQLLPLQGSKLTLRKLIQSVKGAVALVKQGRNAVPATVWCLLCAYSSMQAVAAPSTSVKLVTQVMPSDLPAGNCTQKCSPDLQTNLLLAYVAAGIRLSWDPVHRQDVRWRKLDCMQNKGYACPREAPAFSLKVHQNADNCKFRLFVVLLGMYCLLSCTALVHPCLQTPGSLCANKLYQIRKPA